MGIILIVGVMALSGGLCRLFNYLNERSANVRHRDGEPSGPYRSMPSVVIPDTVPTEWIDTYRTEQGG